MYSTALRLAQQVMCIDYPGPESLPHTNERNHYFLVQRQSRLGRQLVDFEEIIQNEETH